MEDQSLTRLTVLGGGVLGSQIAWHSAFKGKHVKVYDLYEEGLNSCRAAHARYEDIYRKELGASNGEIAATRDRLDFTTDLAAAVAEADIVIEAVPEVPEVKKQTYSEMAPLLPSHTLLATNSSTFLPSDFALDTGRPEKYCALHFANLIWSMNIGEIMGHLGTSEHTLTAVTRFAIEIGMVPIPVEKEQNGYVLNSMLIPLGNAAQSLVTNGVASPEVVDRTYMIMNRGCAVGPCGMLDIIGMTTAYNIFSYWGEANADQQMLKNAEYIKTRFIDQDKMGLATGEGYYRYPDPAYAAPDFLDAPDVSAATEIAQKVLLV
jgi:3-hydroxybutyryl-CoA dehydrogenase